jgi:hypothetical protein
MKLQIEKKNHCFNTIIEEIISLWENNSVFPARHFPNYYSQLLPYKKKKIIINTFVTATNQILIESIKSKLLGA